MKTTCANGVLGLALAIAIFGAGRNVMAGVSSPSKSQAAKVIELHAPNNATQSVTVWIPKPAPATPLRTAVPTLRGTQVIQLHAPNNATGTATVWLGR